MTVREVSMHMDGYRHREERLDFRAALIAAMIANANRDPKKRRKPYQPQDFMPRYERKAQTWEQQLRVVRALNAAFGGADTS